jgi:hypothetical protein
MNLRPLAFRLSKALLWWSVDPPLRDHLGVAFRVIDGRLPEAAARNDRLAALAAIEAGIKAATGTRGIPSLLQVEQVDALFSALAHAKGAR